jgi:hypothetical protein
VPSPGPGAGELDAAEDGEITGCDESRARGVASRLAALLPAELRSPN